MNELISKIDKIIKSESWNYLESKERLFVKTVSDKLNQNMFLNSEESTTIDVILRKYQIH